MEVKLAKMQASESMPQRRTERTIAVLDKPPRDPGGIRVGTRWMMPTPLR